MIDETRFYTPPEVVRETRCPRDLVYADLANGRLGALRRGKRWLVPGSAVLEWLRSIATQGGPDEHRC